MTSFKDFGEPNNLKFGRYILPVIPVGAKLSEHSKLTPDRLGKIPGRRKKDGTWAGFPKERPWTDEWKMRSERVIPGIMRTFASWYEADGLPEHIAMRARELPAIDVDIPDKLFAKVAYDIAMEVFGFAPVRGRPNSEKFLLCYRRLMTESPIIKIRKVWETPSGISFAVESLGEGQQWLYGGPHPSGVNYEWLMGQDPVAVGWDNLTCITHDQVNIFFRRLDEEFANHGCKVVKEGGGVKLSGIASAPRQEVGPTHGDICLDIALLKDLLTNYLPVTHHEFVTYDAWTNACIAIVTACGRDESFYDFFEEWCRGDPRNDESMIRGKWESVRESSIGWSYLCSIGGQYGFTGHLDFEALGDDLEAEAGDDHWEERYAYIEPQKEFVDLKSPNLQRYDLQAFKLKFPEFTPWSPKTNAVMRYLRSNRKTVCDGYTYLPGAPQLVEESGRRLLNRWSPGLPSPDGPIADEDIRPWLDHVEYVVTDTRERAILLDWLAHLIQRRHPKVNYAMLLGGVQGIGKSLLFDPIVRFLGRQNVRTTSETEIKDKYTSWVAERELVMMEEVRGLSDEVMNRLKMYIAAPPYMVPVNEKNIRHYEVPNVARFAAFTNSEYALQLSDDDRRWCIIWSSAVPKEPGYYTELAKWSEHTAALVGGWLAQRDLAGFDAHGRAPITEAKKEMRLAAMGSLDQWVHEAIANGRAPIETDLVSVEDVLSRLPYDARNLRPTPTEKSLAMALKNAGALKLERVSLGKVLETTGSSRTVLWAVRRQTMLRHLSRDKLVDLFWKEQAERLRKDADQILGGYQEKAA